MLLLLSQVLVIELCDAVAVGVLRIPSLSLLSLAPDQAPVRGDDHVLGAGDGDDPTGDGQVARGRGQHLDRFFRNLKNYLTMH